MNVDHKIKFLFLSAFAISGMAHATITCDPIGDAAPVIDPPPTAVTACFSDFSCSFTGYVFSSTSKLWSVDASSDVNFSYEFDSTAQAATIQGSRGGGAMMPAETLDTHGWIYGNNGQSLGLNLNIHSGNGMSLTVEDTSGVTTIVYSNTMDFTNARLDVSFDSDGAGGVILSVDLLDSFGTNLYSNNFVSTGWDPSTSASLGAYKTQDSWDHSGAGVSILNGTYLDSNNSGRPEDGIKVCSDCVPEPSSALLCCTAALGFLLRRRKI